MISEPVPGNLSQRKSKVSERADAKEIRERDIAAAKELRAQELAADDRKQALQLEEEKLKLAADKLR